MQQKISKNQKSEESFHFVQEILRFMEEETQISRGVNLRGRGPAFFSSSTPTSPPPGGPPSVTPAASQFNRGDHTFVLDTLGGSESSSWVNATPAVAISSSPTPDQIHSEKDCDESSHEGSGTPEQQGTGCAYMRMPPFGSPKLGPRPSANRKPPDHFNPSIGRDDSAGEKI
ncbi:unnamed protein product [Penicillium pancosmium]